MHNENTKDADLFEEGVPNQNPEQTYEIQVDGETLQLTLPQILEAAQAGLTKRSQNIRRDGAMQEMDNGAIYAAFLEEYPDVAPTDIPQEVWDLAAREGSLVAAYRKYELMQLRMELDTLQKNEQNRQSEVGSAASDGETPAADPVVRALLGTK